MRKLASFLSGTMMGAIVGAIIALVLAPSSGDSTRAGIQDRFQSIQIEVREAAANRRAALEEQLQSLRTPRKSG